MLLNLLICSLAALISVSGQSDATSHPVVYTRNGQLRGLRTSMGDNSYVDTFLMVPYARPPTGDLRFRRPEPPDSWTGVREATQYGPQCTQGPWFPQIPVVQTFNNSEDCLYLNVYTPKKTGSSPLPVMFYIHGGALIKGTGNTFDGTLLAAKGVVVVTINYRLEALGFLSTEDGASPGNYGLWDMIRALEWVRDSISAFNGDPNDVTLFALSAGAESTSLLIESKLTRGLFHKAIMESGVSLIRGTTDNPRVSPSPRDNARKLAERMGCATENSIRMLACLRTKEAQALSDSSADLRFRPVPETTLHMTGVLSGDPINVIEQGDVQNVTTIRGFNHDDGTAFMMGFDQEDDGFTLEEVTTLIRNDVDSFYAQTGLQVDKNQVVSQVLDLYIHQPNATDPIQIRAAYAELYNDLAYVVPTVLETQLMTKLLVQPQYFFRFSFRSSNRLSPQWTGVMHTDELDYVFGSPVSGDNIFINFVSNWTDADKDVSENVMAMWTNFAKNGDPTPESGVNGVKWLPWTQNSPAVLDITQHPHMIYDLVSPRVTFWTEKLQAVLRARSGVSHPDIIG